MNKSAINYVENKVNNRKNTAKKIQKDIME